MEKRDYVIVGGGMTADAAVRGILEADARANIKIISAEPDPPYDRPPLTKGLWTGKDLDDIWRNTADTGAELVLGRTVERLVPEKKVVVDSDGREYPYGKLLLATGATPRQMQLDSDEIVYYRNVADYRTIKEKAEKNERAIVIGGGFIGAEIAAALTLNGVQVAMVFPETGISGRLFPSGLSEMITDRYRDKGVEIYAGVKPTALEKNDGTYRATLEDGSSLEGDFVIAGIGVSPNTQLAEAAGLKVDDGIWVDSNCQTSTSDIYAAGDCAQFHCSLLDSDLRVEHEDNANSMGKAAGKNMGGADVEYDYLPFFYSDLFDMGYEAIGKTNSKLDTVEFWKDNAKEKGIVFYAEDQMLCGAVFWNVWDMVDPFRALLKESRKADQARLASWVSEKAGIE